MTRHDKLKQFFKENFDLTLSDNFKPCINAWVKNPPIEMDSDDCSTRSCATCKARTWWDEDEDDDEDDEYDEHLKREVVIGHKMSDIESLIAIMDSGEIIRPDEMNKVLEVYLKGGKDGI